MQARCGKSQHGGRALDDERDRSRVVESAVQRVLEQEAHWRRRFPGKTDSVEESGANGAAATYSDPVKRPKKRRPSQGGRPSDLYGRRIFPKRVALPGNRNRPPTATDAPSQLTAPASPSAALLKHSKVVALDCEFVGVGDDRKRHALARVSIVDYFGAVLLDRYVRVDEPVTDFRTRYSGIRPHHLKSADAASFREVQAEVARWIDGRLLVGHELQNDLRVLLLSHPRRRTRDTARYRPLRARLGTSAARTPSLQRLAAEILGTHIQGGIPETDASLSGDAVDGYAIVQGTLGHDSVEDARAALELYKRFRKTWEEDVARGDPNGKRRVTTVLGPVSHKVADTS
ncbi:hypothetical protein CDCA_CDCA03G0853 [Cyanidium caldarium]|uniref:RNA exonuclease 4 n=1 Tax=Cyanidium caldarium TaxID=2771 RepID=A0AAV9ISG2_CYACA|nr:hypothetical protein CDCA_CDCA03G0853 [Cyanidium caldarium]